MPIVGPSKRLEFDKIFKPSSSSYGPFTALVLVGSCGNSVMVTHSSSNGVAQTLARSNGVTKPPSWKGPKLVSLNQQMDQ